MNKSRRFVASRSILVLFVWIVGLAGVVYCLGALRWVFVAPRDPIGLAGWDTKNKLADYERTGNPKPVADWLMAYHGEASSHQVMMTLVDWAIDHQREFLTLIESVDLKDRKLLLERFTWGLMDSGQDGEFRKAFKDYRSPVLDEMEVESWPR